MHNQSLNKEQNIKVIPGGNQMSLISDTEEVIKFLEFVGRKSILNEHAINNRLTACNNLFSALNEDEDNLDYILNNLDVLVNRFRNRNNNVRASTLKVYKSRVKSSIEDFQSWSADPFAWERAVTDKAKSSNLDGRKERKRNRSNPEKKGSIGKKKKVGKKASTNQEKQVKLTENESKDSRKVTFPIRPDFCVEMVLPAEGLSLKELHRLGLFLYPYCKDIDPEKTQWPSLLN